MSISKVDDRISERLVSARLNSTPLPNFPGPLPTSLDQAYAIQSASINRWHDYVVAWKVAKLPEIDRGRFPAERLIGPVFKSSLRRVEPGACTVMPVYEGGFTAIEAEYALELGATIQPSGREYSDNELADLVDAVYGVAEIASSPIALLNAIGAMAVIPDFGGNCGLVVGPEIDDWRTAPSRSLTASVTVDGKKVGESTIEGIDQDPLQTVRALIEICSERGIQLPKGTLISTGALTGVHDMGVSSTAQVDFGLFGSFEVTFEAATPIA
ncbi:MAG: fumarylacetoacetate hydrolase family protein [Gammaproteobacteria bacterium]|nr:fumarylacetoacetate hydrolase family protein [Gammaproteobacteria bacterium]